jgi:hypothetical protein
LCFAVSASISWHRPGDIASSVRQSALIPGPILIGSEAAKGDSAWLKSLGLWTCNIYESRYCGVGVLGALLPQGGISFIYAPILDRNAARFPLRPASLDWNDYRPQMTAKLLSELDRVAKVVGGGIIID